jgi:hypothetical protein
MLVTNILAKNDHASGTEAAIGLIKQILRDITCRNLPIYVTQNNQTCKQYCSTESTGCCGMLDHLLDCQTSKGVQSLTNPEDMQKGDWEIIFKYYLTDLRKYMEGSESQKHVVMRIYSLLLKPFAQPMGHGLYTMLKNYCPNLSLLEQKVMDTDTKELQSKEICDLLVMNPGSHDASIPLYLTLHYRPEDWRGKTGAEILSSDNKPSVEHHKLH